MWRLKQVCSDAAIYGANIPATRYQAEGTRFLRTTDIADDGSLNAEGVFLPPELVDDYVLSDGDILLSRSGTVGRSFLYLASLHGPCAYAGYLARFVPSSVILPKYLFLFTKTSAFSSFLRTMVISSTIENVNAEKYANGHVPLPPLPEQTAIVRYLDHADLRIRWYVSAKRKLIALLEEEKQAIVNQAVTRGLDPNVSLKPSGVDWLGDVPAHWAVRTLGQAADSFRTGPFGSMLHQSDYVESGTPVINPVHMRDGEIVEDPSCTVSEIVADRLSSYRLGLHDIVFSRRGDLGRSALVRSRETGWLCGTGSIRVRIEYRDMEPEFLIRALQVRRVGEYLSLMSVGATLANLNTGILKSVPILVPPIQEQRDLLEFIGRRSRTIGAEIARARRQVELVQEYRTRLIADVVTGKLDVREAAAQLPDESYEEAPIDGDGLMADNMDEELYDAEESESVSHSEA